MSLLVVVGLVGAMKTAFITTNEQMAVDFNVSYTAVAALTAAPLMVSAFSGMASSIAARIWGKRPAYLQSFAFIFIGTLWNMTARKNFGSCMGARVFQGIGWGAFDTLVLGSIQDTYYVSQMAPLSKGQALIKSQEHERHLRVSIYNIFTIATTWGPPLIGGIASDRAGSFTVQFQIINAIYLLAVPLLAFGAPETVFDRSKAAIGTIPASSVPRGWNLRRMLRKENVIGYLEKMRPFSFKGPVTLPTILQAPRASCAPTTCLVFLVSFIPYCTLWGMTASLALLLNETNPDSSPATIGALMTGPWIASLLLAFGFCFWSNFNRRFGPRMNTLAIAVGASLALTGILSSGLVIHKSLTKPSSTNSSNPDSISPSILALLLGILAAGISTLDAPARHLIARSASFTAPSVASAQRSVADMHTGVAVLRSFAAGVFVVAFPSVDGLRGAAIGLGVAQGVVAGAVAALWWFAEEGVWKADGRVMGLVDLSSLKQQSASFFDTE